jgi:peptide-methionine (S)-S-oxide reductase
MQAEANHPSPGKQIAVLGGGCFWCIEPVFDELLGVESVESGYTGGHTANPTYKDICRGDTGHAEVIRITFDPAVISFRDVLGVFFAVHDPTTLNRQGHDTGTQYRSAVFYQSAEQKVEAEKLIAELGAAGLWPNPIVTEVVPAQPFYLAEDHHQEYFRYNPNQPYCQAVIAPKLAKFRQHYLARLKK